MVGVPCTRGRVFFGLMRGIILFRRMGVKSKYYDVGYIMSYLKKINMEG